jgi:hypothetical protein
MVNKLCICWSEKLDIFEMHGATTKIISGRVLVIFKMFPPLVNRRVSFPASFGTYGN